MLWGLLLLMGNADLPVAGADHGAEIARHCDAEWPGDTSMQALCMRHGTEGVARFEQARKALGDKIAEELAGCIQVWTTKGAPDWAMIGACARAHAESHHVTIP